MLKAIREGLFEQRGRENRDNLLSETVLNDEIKEKTMFLLEEPQRRQFPIMVNLHAINLKGFRITMETHLCAASMKTFPVRLN